MRTYCTAQGTLLNVMWQPGREGSLGRMDTCMCMVESLCSPLQTITMLLIGYTSIQNKASFDSFARWGYCKVQP